MMGMNSRRLVAWLLSVGGALGVGAGCSGPQDGSASDQVVTIHTPAPGTTEWLVTARKDQDFVKVLVDESIKSPTLMRGWLEQIPGGQVPRAVAYIRAHPDASSYILLLVLRKQHRPSYNDIPGEIKAAVLCDALRTVGFVNDWGILEEGSASDGEAAEALLEMGRPALSHVAPLLADRSKVFLWGSKETMLPEIYHYRRADYAYRYASLLLGRQPAAFHRDPAERDKDIERLEKDLDHVQ